MEWSHGKAALEKLRSQIRSLLRREVSDSRDAIRLEISRGGIPNSVGIHALESSVLLLQE